MKIKKPFIFLVILLLFAIIFYAKAYNKNNLEIKLLEPMGKMIGSSQTENISIKLRDVEIYTGHICPGVATGFISTKIALQKLYNGEKAIRGNIDIATNEYSDLIDVASFVIRARFINDEDFGKVIIDKKIKAKKNKQVIIFKRRDNNEMVRIIFDRSKLFSAKEMKTLKEIKLKVFSGKATISEKEKFQNILQEKVKEILGTNGGKIIAIRKISNYAFPEIEENLDYEKNN